MTRFSIALLLAVTGTYAAPQAATRTSDAQAAPATFTANTKVGPGGSDFEDSAHFRVYGGKTGQVDSALAMLEGAYDCFVGTLGWRSSGLSFNAGSSDDGPFYKTNVYSVDRLEGAAGVMHSDYETGLAFLEVVDEYLDTPGVTVHEYGHGLHYHQRTWVNQGRTGAWWETLANWVADTYKTSDICASSREKHGQESSRTEIELNKIIGDSFQVLVDGTADSGNYYQQWPFFTFLTNNPDDFAGLGQDTLRQMMIQYEENSNETPLHTLARVSQNSSVGDIVGRYWARMAYVDIGHPSAQEVFLQQRSSINYANVDAQSSGTYKVKSDRQPRYMGASIIPLKASGGVVGVKVTADADFVATVAVYSEAGTRYVSVANGAAEVTIGSGEEASVVVANTPAEAILYDGFALSDEVQKGLDFTLTLTGATVA